MFRALLVIAFCLFWSQLAQAKNEYVDGVSAYIDGEFELAQTLWLREAKDNKARAMFNLGLLHSQGKLSNANPAKAERWFKLAGQNGYAPADYHFATLMLQQGRSHAEIKPYLQRAVANGSYLASRMWNEVYTDVVTVPRLSQQVLESPTLGSSINEPAIGSASQRPRYLTEDWIASRDSSEWTIQMLAFQEKAKVIEFIDQHKLHREAAYFAEPAASGMLYKLIYGAYDSKQQADVARGKLSNDLREYGPWLRTVASIKEVIANR